MSETWPLKLDKTEMSMIRYRSDTDMRVSGLHSKKRKGRKMQSSGKLMGLEPVCLVIKNGIVDGLDMRLWNVNMTMIG